MKFRWPAPTLDTAPFHSPLTFADRIAGNWAEHPSGCWRWKRAPVGEYGTICFAVSPGRYVKVRAHRAAFYAATGVWPPKGRMVCHHCDVKECVRPDHLYLGNAKTNARDTLARNAGWRARMAESRGTIAQRKLSSEQVAEIRALYFGPTGSGHPDNHWLRRPPGAPALAKALGISVACVSKAMAGRAKADARHVRRRITPAQILAARAEVLARWTEARAKAEPLWGHRSLAARYGVSDTLITKLLSGVGYGPRR